MIDLILEFSVHNTSTELYIRLLSTFKKEFIPQILGFKFQKLAGGKDIAARIENSDKHQKRAAYANVTGSMTMQAANPKQLARVTAKLIKAGLVCVEEIWPHLGPADQVVSEVYRENYEIAFEVGGSVEADFQKELRPQTDYHSRRREGRDDSDGQEHKSPVHL